MVGEIDNNSYCAWLIASANGAAVAETCGHCTGQWFGGDTLVAEGRRIGEMLRFSCVHLLLCLAVADDIDLHRMCLEQARRNQHYLEIRSGPLPQATFWLEPYALYLTP